MAEASIDGMAFFTQRTTAGGAFMLNSVASSSAIETIGEWAVEVRESSEIIVARGPNGGSYEKARDSALAAANRGLDLLCLRGTAKLSIGHAWTEHIVWWHEDSTSVVRLFGSPTTNWKVGPVTVTGGTPVIPPAPEWHESTRYYRLSQLSEDLFDSFRNIYLAIESILDAIAPQSRSEGEGQWFRRALGAAGKLVDLSPLVPDGADPVAALYDDLYVGTRNLVFHAKGTRAYHLPHSGTERLAVADTNRRAVALYLRLAEQVVHLRPPSGGIFAGFWKMQIEGLAQRLTLVATNDPAPMSETDTAVNPSGGDLLKLNTRREPVYDRPFELAFLGVADGRAAVKLGHVTRVCSTVDGEPLTGCIPEGSLRIGAIGRFEALVILRARNVNEPKRDFAS